MILVDTSVWIAHLRTADIQLASLLESGLILVHPFVIGEIAVGNLIDRALVLGDLSDLPHVNEATDPEVLRFIDDYAIAGRGIGYIDAHLLAAVRLTPGTELWTNDRRLHGLAAEFGCAFQPRQA